MAEVNRICMLSGLGLACSQTLYFPFRRARVINKNRGGFIIFQKDEKKN